MYIYIFFLLSVCMCTHGANVRKDILPPGISVSTSSQYNHLEFTFDSPNVAESDDDRLVFVLLALEETHGRNLVADTIKNALEGFRDIVINGNGDIPVLDPLIVPVIGPYVTTEINGRPASVTINNFRMEGLRWYFVDHVTFNPFTLTLSLQITIPRLTFTGRYDVVASLAPLLTYRAGGNFRLFVNRIDFGVEVRLGTNLLGGHLVLRRLDFKIDIHDTHVHIDGMTGSSILNSMISSMVHNVSQDLVQSQMSNVSQLLSEQLFDIINDILKDYTINDILG